jgi:predicted dehydrogenase
MQGTAREERTRPVAQDAAASASPRRPKLAFVGVGWIGRHRMESLLESGEVEAVAIADACGEALSAAAALAPEAKQAGTLEEVLSLSPDGVVIATPSALHAEQAKAALERGASVFCQKPLARTGAEAEAIVAAARKADRLLGVDLSYRYTAAYGAIAELIRSGELGELYALDLTFHNAYGPDKAWFRDPALSGGGCMIDLGVHLIDLAMLSLGWPEIDEVRGQMFCGGSPLRDPAKEIEDYATAELRAADGRSARIACSWNLHAGREAVIECAFYGTRGGAVLRNVNGSFYDFTAEHFRGTTRQVLVEPPDAWGGRAALAWARRLALMPGFDPEAERFIQVSRIIDRVYGRVPS